MGVESNSLLNIQTFRKTTVSRETFKQEEQTIIPGKTFAMLAFGGLAV
jgi:hypothetical protein